MAGLTISPDSIAQARQSGYSDQDIADYLSQKSPDQFKQAFDAGYTPSQVLDHLGGANVPNVAVDAVKGIPNAAVSQWGNLLSASGQAGALENADPDMAATMPTAAQATDALKQNVTGPLYEAKTKPGKIISDAVGSLAVPSSYIGPAGPVRSALSNAAASGMADTAGALTNENPYARLAAAALAPTFMPKAAERVIPAAEDLINAGGSGKDALRDMNFAVKPSELSGWAQAQMDMLTKGNTREPAAQQTFAVLRDIANQNASAFTAHDLDWVSKRLNLIQDEPAAGLVRGSLNDRMAAGFNPSNVIAGNPAEFSRTWADANANYAAGKRAESFDKAAAAAYDGAMAANSGKNAGNKYRGTLASYVNNDGKTWGLNDAEVNAIRDLAHGNAYLNTMRSIGNRFGGGGGLGQTGLMILGGSIGGGGGAVEGGTSGAGVGATLGTIAPLVIGSLSRKAYNSGVQKRVDAISQMMRSRSPLAQAQPIVPDRTPSYLIRLLNAARNAQ